MSPTDSMNREKGAESIQGAPAQIGGGARAATRGAIITMSGRGVRLLCQLIGLLVIARYLTAAEYGLVAMASAVIGIAGVLGDFGLSVSSSRSPELHADERNALFWLNVAVGTILAIVMAALSPVLARFYGQPEVVSIVLALSPLFVINGAISQYRVDSMRQKKYFWAAAIDMVAPAAGLIVAISAAVSGAGYWTLVIQSWVVTSFTFVLLVFACRWGPGLPAIRVSLSHHVGFGSLLTLTQMSNYFSSNIAPIALGKTFGPDAVGIFTRAYQLFSIPVDQITAPLTPLLLPILAKVNPDNLSDILQRIQRCLSYSILGVCLFIAVGGTPLTIVLLGVHWAEAGNIVQILMIGAVFHVPRYAYYWAFMVVGRANLLFWCEFPPRLVMAGLITLGASYGESGVALGHSLGLAVCWLVPALFGVRSLGWKVAPLALASARPILLYLWAYSAGAFARSALERSGINPVWCVVLTFTVTMLAIFLALVMPVFRKDARELLELTRMLGRKGQAPGARA